MRVLVFCALFLVLGSTSASIASPFSSRHEVNYPESGSLAPGNTSPQFSPQTSSSSDGTSVLPAAPDDSSLRDSKQSTVIVPARTPAQRNEFTRAEFDLLLGPKVAVARPGSEVILTAGLRDQAGYLRTNQRIDWSISPSSVGHFSKIQERSPGNVLVFDFVKPQIISDTQAVTSTSRSELVLDRGTPNLNDDVVVLRGQSWISVSSPREGVTLVTASVRKQPDSPCITQTSKIIWVDAAIKLPESKVLDFGSTYTLATALRRVSNEQPLERWRVRYTICGNSSAVFEDGNKMLEVFTNQLGEAKVQMHQSVARQEETVVTLQIIRPAGDVFPEPVVVQESRLHFLWKPNTVNIQKVMQREAHIGDIVPASIFVTNLTDYPLQNVRIVDIAQTGLVLKGAAPEGKDAPEGRQWLLETLAPHETYTIQLNYRVEQPGSYLSLAHVQTQKMGNDLVVECFASLSAGSDTSPYKPDLPQETPGQNPNSGDEGDPNAEKTFRTFDDSTKPLPPPPDDTEDVYVPQNTEGGSTPKGTTGALLPPSVPPLVGDKNEASDQLSEKAEQGPTYAPVFPPDDPYAQVGLKILVPARGKVGEMLRAFIHIENRSDMDMKNVGILVLNSHGLVNQNPDGKKYSIGRNIPNIPAQKMVSIRADFEVAKGGEQVIEVHISLYNKKEYVSKATIQIQEDANSSLAEPPSEGSPSLLEPPSEGLPSPPEPPSEGLPSLPEPPSEGLPSPPEPPSEGLPSLPETSSKSVSPAPGMNESKISEDGKVGEFLDLNGESGDPSFTVVLKESKNHIQVGDEFTYTLQVMNTMSVAAKGLEILFVVSLENVEIQKAGITGQTSVKEVTEAGLIHFAPISELLPGKSVQYQIPLKALKAGTFQPHVQLLEAGKIKTLKTKETRIY